MPRRGPLVAMAEPLQLHEPMLLFRSLALGLLGACFFLIATRPTTVVVRERERIEVPNLSGMRGLPSQGPSVIDVAADVNPMLIPSLVQLREGEHVAAIDDIPVANDLEAGRLLGVQGERAIPSLHRYIDLQVTGPRGERRILVLLH
jgi:hypothetical protein